MELLEVHYLANASGEIYFALVTDWLDSPTEHADGDTELVARARLEIERLNEVHGDYFLLLHRARRFNPAEGVWMGWERKRGKLEELNRLLRGDETTSFTTVEGRLPHDVKYVLTLDSDTRLPRDAARRLIGKLGHPLNRPVWEPGADRPSRGFGILQPRVTPSLPMNEASSYFQRAFSTPPGLDPYAFAVSDVYQDLFGEGSFTGKGIYDVDAVIAATAGPHPGEPDPQPRSARRELCPLGPGHRRRSRRAVPDVATRWRLHAPIGGLAATGNSCRGSFGDDPASAGSVDGRCSTTFAALCSPISLVAALIVGLALLPPSGGAGVVGCARRHLLRAAAPSCLQSAPSLADRDHACAARSMASSTTSPAVSLRGLLDFTFLGHHAWLMADATVRTWFRMGWSRRRRLEWTTAAQVSAGTKGTVNHYIRLMWGGFVPAVLAVVAGVVGGYWNLAVATLVATIWLAAPLVAAMGLRAVQLGRTDCVP